MVAHDLTEGAPTGTLPDLLDLEPTGSRSFRAPGHGRTGNTRLAFGGAVLAQALVAAGRTVDPDRRVHSLHGWFLKPADANAPTDLTVEAIRDGGSYSTRSVTAEQGAGAVLRLTASFALPEQGAEHQVPVLDAPAPEDATPPEAVVSATGPVRHWLDQLTKRQPLEVRFAAELPRLAAARGQSAPPRQRLWLRWRDALPDDPLVHAGALAYLSDLLLLSTALAPHRTVIGAPEVAAASLDQAVWLHRPARADQWLFYDQQSPTAAGGRALCQGRLFDRSGSLVATVVQEGMIRIRPVPADAGGDDADGGNAGG